MKILSEPKLRYHFPKNVKFHFCHVFWVVFWFYPQFHFDIYVWRWREPKLIFFLVTSIALPFQIKKCQIPKIFLSMWVFVALKCQQNSEILQVVWTLTANKYWTRCLRCLIFLKTIVFHPYFMEITTLISIWLQLSHNGSSDLLKIFIKLKFVKLA